MHFLGNMHCGVLLAKMIDRQTRKPYFLSIRSCDFTGLRRSTMKVVQHSVASLPWQTSAKKDCRFH